MKHVFRPMVASLEDRLALSSTSAAVAPAATPPAAVVPLAVATTTLDHLYRDTFGRSPDGYAVAAWIPALRAGATLAQVEVQLVNSPEFIANHTSATASVASNEASYVSALYSTVLGRSADPAGLGFWVGQLQAGGLTVPQVAAAFVNSPEAATSSTSILARDSFSNLATNALNGMFQGTLGRAADGVALAAVIPAMQSGMTMAQIATALVASPEYVGKHVSVTASAMANEINYVSALYSTVLGRSADDVGLGFWVAQLQSGTMTVPQVAAAFVNSPEAATSSTSILARVKL